MDNIMMTEMMLHESEQARLDPNRYDTANQIQMQMNGSPIEHMIDDAGRTISEVAHNVGEFLKFSQ